MHGLEVGSSEEWVGGREAKGDGLPMGSTPSTLRPLLRAHLSRDLLPTLPGACGGPQIFQAHLLH